MSNKLIAKIKEQAGKDWPVRIYAERVLNGRSRSYKMEIPERENSPLIQHTMLGIEMKVGRLRFSCPDIATARYLSIFARIGCDEIAIPYDITKISDIADELEAGWQATLLMLNKEMVNEDPKRIRSARTSLLKVMRTDIRELGAGDTMPSFIVSTRRNSGGQN